MKSILYTQLTKVRLEQQISYLGKKDKPKLFRGRDTTIYGEPLKLWKITIQVEEVPQEEIKYRLTREDLEEKYTSKEIKAGYLEYSRRPHKTMRSDDAYSTWEDTMNWHELMPEEQEKYIKSAK